MRNNAKQTDQSMSIITYSVGNAETQPSSAINLYRLGRMLIIIETQSGWYLSRGAGAVVGFVSGGLAPIEAQQVEYLLGHLGQHCRDQHVHGKQAKRERIQEKHVMIGQRGRRMTFLIAKYKEDWIWFQLIGRRVHTSLPWYQQKIHETMLIASTSISTVQ